MKKHYSLIEIMVAMGIFALMMTLLMNFFGQATDVMTRETNRAEKLYEGGVFGVVINKDLNGDNLKVDTTYQMSYLIDGGETKLRFFSTTYDNDGDDSNLLAVSYVYDPAKYTISRFVLKESVATSWADVEDPLNGSILLEGVENVTGVAGVGGFELVVYDDFPTMSDADGVDDGSTAPTLIEGADSLTDTALHEAPDAMNIKLTLNDMTTLNTGTTEENLLVQTRRVMNNRIMLAYSN